MDVVEDGDLVVIAAGSPPGKAGSTNLLKVHKVGDLADTGGHGRSSRGQGKARPVAGKEEEEPGPGLVPLIA